MKFSLRQLLAVVSVNALIAAFLTAIGVGRALSGNFVVSQCIGLSIYAGALAAGRRMTATPRSLYIGMALVVPAGAAAGVGLSILLLGAQHSPWLADMAWQSLLIGLLFGAGISALFYLRGRMSTLEGELRERQLRQALAEKERVDAQLRMLQAQIEPHFLFNTLANLSVLLRSDPARAERLLTDLIAYLRATLQRTRAAESTLGDEIELLKRYLDILGLRLGTRLRYAFDVPQELLSRPFPLLLLQPLVENAITHGIEPQVGGGEVRIAAQADNGRLRLVVADTGAGLRETGSGTGFGLENVRSRLRALFGEAARLDVRANAGQGVIATIEVPA